MLKLVVAALDCGLERSRLLRGQSILRLHFVEHICELSFRRGLAGEHVLQVHLLRRITHNLAALPRALLCCLVDRRGAYMARIDVGRLARTRHAILIVGLPALTCLAGTAIHRPHWLPNQVSTAAGSNRAN